MPEGSNCDFEDVVVFRRRPNRHASARLASPELRFKVLVHRKGGNLPEKLNSVIATTVGQQFPRNSFTAPMDTHVHTGWPLRLQQLYQPLSVLRARNKRLEELDCCR